MARPVMNPTLHGWRMLTAILQIAAFVLFVLPAPAQAAVHRHAGLHAALDQAAAEHGHAVSVTDSATDLADAAPDAGSGHDTCWLGCCSCHAFVGATPVAPAVASWTAQRLPVPAPEAARPDAAPGILPEPPRPFA
ncbi:hypothetical protein [Methylobacterium symbioticum]|uniref:DUF2946 domain-containing protein n=1 Tax=Methylobacterium symbioticum TaxID=2584084 RepID=A0A509E7K4_9HYPH|nr:hypothetical protein [Methylobacterium symbioticum]VUD70266.1 hypothetical protein MET9862_00830 [Methylobacterium symbioticum]